MSTIEQLLQDVRTHWNDAEALGRVGRELHDRNRLDHARTALERSLELDPSSTENWAHLSYCCFRSLKSDEGLEVLRRGVEATQAVAMKSTLSHFVTNEEEREKLKEELATSKDLSARSSLLAHAFYGEKPKEAYEAMRRLVQVHPGAEAPREQFLWTTLNARHREVLEGLDVRDEAVPLADTMIEEDSDRVFGHWAKSQLLMAEKDWDGVLEATEAALERFPDDETMMLLRGRAFEEKNADEDAAHWFARAIGAKPSFVGARVQLGKLFERADKIDQAERLFREIPKANPTYPMGPVSLALFLSRQERWEEAEEAMLQAWKGLPEMFRMAVKHNPDAKVLLERDAVKKVVGD